MVLSIYLRFSMVLGSLLNPRDYSLDIASSSRAIVPADTRAGDTAAILIAATCTNLTTQLFIVIKCKTLLAFYVFAQY